MDSKRHNNKAFVYQLWIEIMLDGTVLNRGFSSQKWRHENTRRMKRNTV